MREQGQALGELSERAGWGNLGLVGWIASGKGLKRKRGGLGGITACLKEVKLQ